MTVEENRIVTLHYVLRENHALGRKLEVMEAAYPFVFYYQSANLLKAFQENLRGLMAGSHFEFVLPCRQAYGDHLPSHVVTVPIERFVIDDRLGESIQEVGEYVSLTDNLGDQHRGKIVEKNALHLKVDINHAMAGKDLHFKGRIMHVREASVEEIIQQRYIAPTHP